MKKMMISIENLAKIILISVLLLNCKNKKSPNNMIFEWDNVVNLERNLEFSQINEYKDKNLFIFAYSYSFSSGGGCKILNCNLLGDTPILKSLYESNSQALSYIFVNDSHICCIIDDFDDNTLKSTIKITKNKGLNWKEIKTPIEYPVNCFFSNEIIIVEGNLQGTGQVFKSIDTGLNWYRINVGRKYKSFSFLNNNGPLNEIFCIGSTDYQSKNNELVVLNIKDNSLKSLIELNNINSYFKPVSKNKFLHCINDGNEVTIYDYIKGTLQESEEFKLPSEIDQLINIYLNDSFYIVSANLKVANRDAISSKILSWISYDKGESWLPFYQENEYKLVFNDCGELFVIDNKKNILRRRS